MRLIIRLILSLFLFIESANNLNGQNVFRVENQSSAEILIREVKDIEKADLFVFRSLGRVLNSKNDGIWYFTTYKASRHKNIYFITNDDYKSHKQIINIHFVKSRFYAGWRNLDKAYLMK